MDCDAIRPELEAYALGALDDAGAAAVAAHLAGCPGCRAELAALEASASALPRALAAASPLSPPDRIKERLLATIGAGDQADEPVAAIPTAPAYRPASRNHAADEARIGETAVLRADNGSERARTTPATAPVPLWRRPLAWGGLAAALLLVASFAWGVRLSEALDRERALREAVAGFYSSQQAIVFEVVDSDKTTKRVLLPPAGSDFPSRPYGKVFTRDDMVHVVAMANRLPEAPAGQAYHLWVTLGDRTHLAGVLKPNEEGFAVLVFDADRPGPGYSAAWITLQPTGTTAPGGTTLVVWDADAAS